ncbi:L-aspartate oxidase [Bacillus sp. FJAT-45066]|uniref:L-aspartate oxidase n=1 Tax=Bacillus sp. FJAT-45066 TaxID=2011010 RepID=UPI000BB7A342|nr:L-aspartate oxidase [Bacillus sp. FJAT-45066]
MPNRKIDCLIVGSGLSALMTAKYLSEHMNVMIFTKSKKSSNNSFLAQGGIACVIDKRDHWQFHYEDTLVAGCFLNNKEAVELLVKEGPQHVTNLIQEGMKFDKTNKGTLSLGMEGAHSHHRILHAGGDQTGKELMTFLQENTNVKVVEDETAYELLVHENNCYGIKTLNIQGNIQKYIAKRVVLATGGVGAIYSFTSNDESVTGSALAMAYKAGASLIDLEFMQFHPTMLSVNGKAVGLISEAVRGEGAFLVNEKGERIMKNLHPLEDLAPRDIVSRAIYKCLQKGHRIYLNIKSIQNFKQRFPAISELCCKNNINIESGFIPVVPGAHFFMGGIQTNVYGESSVKNLYAVGEAACNGVHGANRLASNSLLECIVFSKKLAEKIVELDEKEVLNPLSINEEVICNKVYSLVLPAKSEIQTMMMKHVGIVRSEEKLLQMKSWLEKYEAYWTEYTPDNLLKYEDIEIVQMLQLCYLMVDACLQREESRGAHFRDDFPDSMESWDNRRITHTTGETLFV